MSSGQTTESAKSYVFERFFIDGGWTTVDQRGLRRAVATRRKPVGSAPIASASEIACNDDATSGAGKRGPSSRGSRIDEVVEAGTYFLFVDGYGAHTAELAALVTSEMGSPATFSLPAHGLGPFLLMQLTLQFAESYAWTERRGTSMLVREPSGVVGIITPWNVPQVTMLAKLLPALIAGCTVVVKPAPETPLDAMLLAGLLAEADLPPASSPSCRERPKPGGGSSSTPGSTGSRSPAAPTWAGRSPPPAGSGSRAAVSSWVASPPPSSARTPRSRKP